MADRIIFSIRFSYFAVRCCGRTFDWRNLTADKKVPPPFIWICYLKRLSVLLFCTKNFMNEKIGKWLDAAGVTAFWACAVHCLALPLFIGVMPLVGMSFLLDEATERIFIIVSILLAALSLLPAYVREHGKIRSIFLAAAGIGLIIMTHFFLEENLAAKIVFLIAGAIFLSAAHLINRRLCRECAVCHPNWSEKRIEKNFSVRICLT